MKFNNLIGKRQTLREGDYRAENGTIICGICGTARECRIDWPGIGETWAPCMCECEKVKTYKDKENEKKTQKRRIAETRRERAFPSGSNLKYCTLDTDDRKNLPITEAIRKYIDNMGENLQEGKNLVLAGGVGTGKTFMSAAILNAAFDAGFTGLFTTISEQINALTGAFDKNTILHELASYDFVVFDDWGVERETSFALEQIYNIINSRYLAKKPSIFTTNMGLLAFSDENIEKQRIFSRVFENATTIPFTGEDRRYVHFKAQ